MELQESIRDYKSREGFVPAIQRPALRPLKVFAFDPSLQRSPGNLAVVEIGNERLGPGPEGQLVRVVDYDATGDSYYAPVDLDAAEVLIQRGLDPSDSDPRFHQQMVYAVAMKVIENFERALGRPVHFRGGEKLTVLPHAFEGENAFYDPATLSLQFGYFTADTQNPGPNLPGQTVFTCLSQDIVAHETTHAIIDRLRDRFNHPTNRDVLAFHEGLADIVAIFQHFSFPEVLRNEIRATRNDPSSQVASSNWPGNSAMRPAPVGRCGPPQGLRAESRTRISMTSCGRPTSAAQSWSPQCSTHSSVSTEIRSATSSGR